MLGKVLSKTCLGESQGAVTAPCWKSCNIAAVLICYINLRHIAHEIVTVEYFIHCKE